MSLLCVRSVRLPASTRSRRAHGVAARAAALASPLRRQPLIVAKHRLRADAFIKAPHRFTIGLRPITEVEWLSVKTSSDVEELALRAELLSDPTTRPSVLASLPGSEDAQMELTSLVRCWLDQHGAGGSHVQTFEHAGRSVTEDLLIMQRRHDGWALTAACLCFPSRWSLTEKLGLQMAAIHSPVPGLNARLAGRIEKLFDSLKEGALVARMNSDVMDSPDLYQPPGYTAQDSQLTASGGGDDVGGQLLLRFERQTLRRLPRTGAIAFTIKTYQMRLEDVAADAPFARRVHDYYSSMLGTDMANGATPYKRFVPHLCEYLRRGLRPDALVRESSTDDA